MTVEEYSYLGLVVEYNVKQQKRRMAKSGRVNGICRLNCDVNQGRETRRRVERAIAIRRSSRHPSNQLLEMLAG